MPATRRRTQRLIAPALLAALCAAAPAPDQQTMPSLSTYEMALLGPSPKVTDFARRDVGKLGAFGLTAAALRDAGFQADNGDWTPLAKSLGVVSDDTFLSNPTAQAVAEDRRSVVALAYLESAMPKGAFAAQANHPDKATGTVMSPAALAFCSESLGPQGCASYLSGQPLPGFADKPSFRNGGWQAMLATVSRTSLRLPPVQGPKSGKAYQGGWTSMLHMDVLRPSGSQAEIADLWLRYGPHAATGAVALPLIYQTFNLPAGQVVAGIALTDACSDGPSDIGSTQVHTPCPATVMFKPKDGAVSVRTVPGACYMWTEDEPAGSEVSPSRDMTLVKVDASARTVEFVTYRAGTPLPDCSAKGAF